MAKMIQNRDIYSNECTPATAWPLTSGQLLTRRQAFWPNSGM